MKTGVDRIVQQLNGSPEKNKTGVDKILEILESGGGGGGGLPSYTSADKGKFLSLGEGSSSVEPKWENVGGGGGNILTVNFSWDNSDQLVADKTFATVASAITNGYAVQGMSTGEDGPYYLQCIAGEGLDRHGRGSIVFQYTRWHLTGTDPSFTISSVDVETFTLSDDESVSYAYSDRTFS